ncbi:MAG: family 43 glycosylhydrolase [Actinomycetota bacterium]|nr:family 43 glycosylhydrolase [Actinomycetota bacterium]
MHRGRFRSTLSVSRPSIRTLVLSAAVVLTAGTLSAIAPIAQAAPAGAAARPAPAAAAAHARPSNHRGPVAPDYQNPLKLALPGGFSAASCADPDVAHGRGADTSWYLYCTTDRSIDAPGGPDIGLLPLYRSTDLVHWTFLHAAIPAAPGYAVPGAGIWAPNLVYAGGEYRLYFTVSDTTLPGGGAAIGVATGPTPAGPFVVSQTPVVEPTDSAENPGQRRATIDPEVISDHGKSYIFYGSYFGGVSVRTLSADGLHSDISTMKEIATDNRYEGSYIVRHDGWWYYMASSTNCCNGPLTGYTVFAARSRNLLGPYVDRTGRSILDSRVGGTPVVAQNGNTWVGVGHNTVLTDYAGQDWMIYHGVDRNDPYYAGAIGYTKRPGLIDPIDWIKGWPVVNGGAGPSDTPQPGPAAKPGERTAHKVHPVRDPRAGRVIRSASDNFSSHQLGSQWTWIRPDTNSAYSVSSGQLLWATQSGDLQPPTNNLPSVLTEPAPRGDFVVDTKVRVTVPKTGDGHNYVQGGLVIYNDDANYIKLDSVAIGDTRQTEIGKHVTPAAGFPAYGNGVVGPVGEWTYLRLVSKACGAVHCYTAFSSLDGRHWDKGDTWTQAVTASTKIGLISMGGSGFQSQFDFVHVSTVR